MSSLQKKQGPLGWLTTKGERVSYYTYFIGQNMIYTLVTSFLTTYLVLQGVDLTKSATVMMIVKIWDAVNDAIFGVIFDKVNFKSGKKFMPWLRIAMVIIPITTVLLFFIPSGSSETVKLVWLFIAYILWDTGYTFCDAPIYGIITSMTDNIPERSSILSYKSIWGGVGSGLSTIIATLLVGEFVNSNYSVTAIVIAVIAAATMIPACVNLKERFGGEDDEAFTVRRMMSYLVHNKYLLLYYLGFFFYSAANVVNAMNVLVSYYIFHNSQFSIIMIGVSFIPQGIFAFLVPQIIKKIDKMKVFRIASVAIVVTSLPIWIWGMNSIVAFLVFSTIRAIPLGIVGILMFMFTPDCAEYGKYKTGIEAKGITFSIQTFMAKLTGAVSSTLPLFILGFATQWNEYEAENFDELNQIGATQSPETLKVMWFIYVMVPAIGCAIGAILWFFYKLNDHDVQLMAKYNAGEITRDEAESEMLVDYGPFTGDPSKINIAYNNTNGVE